ncbi:hypothetical protein [uncultured Bacteroides sp.]|uniref:hypothetical protein n=1 Tax=uncultured Bacteroides sp. TaxID=162156 RepID=UPI00205D16D8|nr:hypothetical protein [uncultured Bacteroides sp.]DAO30083.1 MAG TPA: hypothetical protein [Microviridae sp.]
MEKKRFYKVIRAFKHNGEIREFPFTLPYTFNEVYALAIDAAIINFKNDYHHGDVDVVRLERCK